MQFLGQLLLLAKYEDTVQMSDVGGGKSELGNYFLEESNNTEACLVRLVSRHKLPVALKREMLRLVFICFYPR